MIRVAPGAVLVFLLAICPAVRAAPNQDDQIWVSLQALGPVYKRLLYFVEIQGRSSGEFANANLGQVLMRPAIGFQVHQRLALYLGYAWVYNRASSGPNPSEDRVYAQISWSIGSLGTASLSSRTRIECRVRSDGDEAAWRARSMLRLVVPLLGERKWLRPLVYAEGFANLNDAAWGPVQGFDQLRAFGGLEIPIFGTSTIEAGYLNQYINFAKGTNQMNHVFFFSMLFRT